MTRSRDVSKGATRNEFIYTATATQTTFSGNDDNSNSLSYTVGQIDVFMNGARLAPADFTATNGTSVVLGAAAAASDIIQVNAFGTFSVSDVLAQRTEFDYTATAGQTTFSGSDNGSNSLSYTAGRIDVYLNGSHLNDTDDYVATNGTSVVLQAGAEVGDLLKVVNHGTVNLVSNILSSDLDLNGNKLDLDADGDTSIHCSTDDQIDIEIAGADDFAFKANKFEVQTGSNIDMNGTELILDADGDTSITADTDDQIDIKVAGADDFKITANTFSALDGSSVLIGGGSSRTVGGVTAALQVEGTAINDSSISLISNGASGTAGLPAKLVFGRTGAATLGTNTVVANGNEVGVISFQAADGSDLESQVASISCTIDAAAGSNDTAGRLQFFTTADGAASATERMKIASDGDILFNTDDEEPWNNSGSGNTGIVMKEDGRLAVTGDNTSPLFVNRVASDGRLVDLLQDGSTEGEISVSGTTVSFNGGHLARWARLSDNSKPTSLLKGTVMSNLDDMVVWEVDGVAKINEQRNQVKVSDSEGDINVAGLFVEWALEQGYNDMNMAMTGDMVIRVAQGVTVQKGDLLMSAGDGTAKPQGDDVVRSKTIAKVISNKVIKTYSDNSFLVPCVVMAC